MPVASNFVKIRLSRNSTNSSGKLYFARRIQRLSPFRHPRSRKVSNFSMANYRFAIFQKTCIFTP